MENLIFSLNATVPVFAMIILGMLFKKIGIIDDVFASKMNKFVFLIPLPVLPVSYTHLDVYKRQLLSSTSPLTFT